MKRFCITAEHILINRALTGPHDTRGVPKQVCCYPEEVSVGEQTVFQQLRYSVKTKTLPVWLQNKIQTEVFSGW